MLAGLASVNEGLRLSIESRLRSVLFVAYVVAAAGLDASISGRLRPRSFIQKPAVTQILRVCNAYPFPSALDVYIRGGTVQLNRHPLVYKDCDEYQPALRVGDRVDFKVGDASAGTFTINALPQGDALMLLVIYRHDDSSTAVAFQSHVFATVRATQVAVLDTYKGPAKSEVRIQDFVVEANSNASDDEPSNVTTPRSELLRYDSVVAIDSGAYEVTLAGPEDGKVHMSSEFIAVHKRSYVLIRCDAAGGDGGVDYPEEIFIYPHSLRSELGFAGRGAALSAVVAVMSAAIILGAM